MNSDDQVKAYIKKIMSQLKEWMYGGKISKLVIVITDKETGEHIERWQFDVCDRVWPLFFFVLTAERYKYSESSLKRANHLQEGQRKPQTKRMQLQSKLPSINFNLH